MHLRKIGFLPLGLPGECALFVRTDPSCSFRMCVAIVFSSPADSARARSCDARLHWLEISMSAHQRLLAALGALRRPALTHLFLSRVEEIERHSGADFHNGILPACKLLVDLTPSEGAPLSVETSFQLIDRLLYWAVNESFGTGWALSAASPQADVGRFVGAAIKASQSVYSDAARTSSDEYRGRWMIEMLKSASVDYDSREHLERHIVTAPSSCDADLLVTWTYLHALARRIATRKIPLGQNDESLWVKCLSASPGRLSEWLSQNSDQVESSDAASFRNWIRVWTCAEVLQSLEATDAGSPRLLPLETWQVRADLAYVIRESLRFRVSGAHRKFTVHPAAYAAALRTVVAHHAYWILGVSPEYDIKSLLQTIGDAPGAEGYYFAAAHLGHVLDMYIVGYFISELDFLGNGGTQSLKSRLAARGAPEAGDLSSREFAQAFALASLYHDIGLTLAPRSSLFGTSKGTHKGILRSASSDADASVRAAVSRLVETATSELCSSGYLESSERRLFESWAARLVTTSEADHALLGAWYLHRQTYDYRRGTETVLRDAVRAILLHGGAPLPVDVVRDPVGTLLLLCDELCDWDPALERGPCPNAVGRSLQAIAVDMAPHESRAAEIRFPGLKIARDGIGRIRARIRTQDGTSPWPRIQLLFRHPDTLPGQVHHMWLTMAQRLGRLRSSGEWWVPEVEISSAVPLQLKQVGITTVDLLERVSHRLQFSVGAGILRWLRMQRTTLTRAGDGVSDRLETVCVGARFELYCREDISTIIDAIDVEANRVLEEEGMRRR